MGNLASYMATKSDISYLDSKIELFKREMVWRADIVIAFISIFNPYLWDKIAQLITVLK